MSTRDRNREFYEKLSYLKGQHTLNINKKLDIQIDLSGKDTMREIDEEILEGLEVALKESVQNNQYVNTIRIISYIARHKEIDDNDRILFDRALSKINGLDFSARELISLIPPDDDSTKKIIVKDLDMFQKTISVVYV